MIYRFCYSLSLILTKSLLKLKVVGRENLPSKDGYILASNHLSYLDPIVLGVGFRRQLHFMAKKSLFNNRLFGKLLNSINVFAVGEQNAGSSAVKEALKRLKAGKVVAIFPEGTRSKDGKLQEAKIGIGFLAIKSKTPVVPARIIGTGEALPIKARFIRFKPVSVYFGRPLDLDRFYQQGESKQNYLRISRLIMEEISKLGVKE
ncbi:MAG: lysophospholipid acyltransferase family protein [Candidatus Omnitrophota bacterium]|nr:lysophospholipid acyltransferase family protein [Candidatus Omnitrophota bacterium]